MILTAINESIWSLMLKELLLYTTSSPQVRVRPAIYYLKKNMSDQVSVLVETLSGIYVHYYDYKIALMTSKVKLKFHLSHRILQTPSPTHPRPPLSQSLLIFTGIYLKLLKTKRKGEKLKQGFRSSCLTAVRISSDRGKF